MWHWDDTVRCTIWKTMVCKLSKNWVKCILPNSTWSLIVLSQATALTNDEGDCYTIEPFQSQCVELLATNLSIYLVVYSLHRNVLPTLQSVPLMINDAIYPHAICSTVIRVMACGLTTFNLYLNLHWLVRFETEWHYRERGKKIKRSFKISVSIFRIQNKNPVSQGTMWNKNLNSF